MATGGWKANPERGGGAREGGTPFGAAGLLAGAEGHADHQAT
jgi:hypothetical protein